MVRPRQSLADTPRDSSGVSQAVLQPTKPLVPILDRSVLLDQLDKGLMGRLVLLLAPAGYGKSTLAAQWRDRMTSKGIDVGWLTLDDRHKDPKRIVEHMAYALQASDLDQPQPGLNRGLPVSESAGSQIQHLFQTISRKGRKTVIILDDFERADSSETGSFLNSFLRDCPPNLVLAICSRKRPSAPLSKLFAQGLIQEIDARKLAFSREDTRRLLPRTFPDSMCNDLYDQTGGWVVALQLARMWLDDGGDFAEIISGFSGAGANMTNYLAEQVIGRLEPDVQDFLEDMAIVDRFSPEMADAIRSRRDSADLLDRARFLFPLVAPDPSDPSLFSYHPLLTDYLRKRLQLRGAGHLAALHRAAALSYAGDPSFANWNSLELALEHALAVDDTQLSIEIVEKIDVSWWFFASGSNALRSFLRHIPTEMLRSRPKLLRAETLCYCSLGLIREGEELIRQFRELLESRTALSPSEDREFAWDLLICEISLDVFLHQLADDAFLEKVEKVMDMRRVNQAELSFIFRAYLANARIQRGEFDEAERLAWDVDEYCRTNNIFYQRCFALIDLAMIETARGRLNRAYGHLEKCHDLASRTESMGALISIRTADQFTACLHLERYDGARLAQTLAALREISVDYGGWLDSHAAELWVEAGMAEMRGGIDSALETVDRMEAVLSQHLSRRMRDYILALRAELLLRGDRVAGPVVETLLDRYGEICESRRQDGGDHICGWREWDPVRLTAARAHIAKRNSSEALDILSDLEREAATGRRLLTVIRCLLLQVMAYRASDESWRAEQKLTEALVLGHETGSLLPFMTEGEQLWHLISVLVESDQLDDAAREHGFAVLHARKRNPGLRPDSLLTQREHMVLAELCQGHVNKVIARNLDLSVNTVKHHLKAIFAKLNVKSRQDAVETARKRHLIG